MMDFTEWNDASLAIKIHVAMAVIGMVTGAVVLMARKGTSRHRTLGRVFGIAAVLTALTSFLIHEIRLWGIWSPIHLLSVYTIVAVCVGVIAIRRGRVGLHTAAMTQLYLGGFVIAGAFTLIPDRLMFVTFIRPALRALFGDSSVMVGQIAWIIPIAAIMFAIWQMRGPQIGWRNRRA